jgi:hypothetical protein
VFFNQALVYSTVSNKTSNADEQHTIKNADRLRNTNHVSGGLTEAANRAINRALELASRRERLAAPAHVQQQQLAAASG